MYNGVGVSTARGTGTNGFVQRNLSHIGKPVVSSLYNDKDRAKRMPISIKKETNPEIVEHNRKRKIELECVKYQIELEDKNVDEEEINKLVSALRTKLFAEDEEYMNKTIIIEGNEVKYHQHIKNVESQEKNFKMRKAFGLGEDHVRNSYFGREKKDINEINMLTGKPRYMDAVDKDAPKLIKKKSSEEMESDDIEDLLEQSKKRAKNHRHKIDDELCRMTKTKPVISYRENDESCRKRTTKNSKR